MKNYESTEQVAPQVSPPADRPYLYSTESAVKVPLLLSVITAFIVAIAVWVFAEFIFNALDAWKWALALGVLALLVIWFFLFRHRIYQIEELLGVDITGDGVVGEPEPIIRKVRIEQTKIKDNGHVQINNFDLPIDDEKLEELAIGLLRGKRFSERQWAGNGKPFSSDEFRETQQAFVDRGWAIWRNEEEHRQGAKLTDDGKEAMRQFADLEGIL